MLTPVNKRLNLLKSLHPFSHILICLVLSSLVFACGSLPRLGLILGLSFAYAALRLGKEWKKLLKHLWHSMPFIVSIAVLQLVFRQEGRLLWSSGILRISSGGFYWMAVLSMRLATIVVCAKAISRSSFKDFQAAFAFLRLPEEFGFMLSYGVQLVPGFTKRLNGFTQSLRLRGIEPSHLPLRQRLLVYKIMAVTSLAGVINGSTLAAIALELRGFRSKGKRSCLHKQSVGIADALCCFCLILLSIYCFV